VVFEVPMCSGVQQPSSERYPFVELQGDGGCPRIEARSSGGREVRNRHPGPAEELGQGPRDLVSSDLAAIAFTSVFDAGSCGPRLIHAEMIGPPPFSLGRWREVADTIFRPNTPTWESCIVLGVSSRGTDTRSLVATLIPSSAPLAVETSTHPAVLLFVLD
jgi:hypothetical protein